MGFFIRDKAGYLLMSSCAHDFRCIQVPNEDMGFFIRDEAGLVFPPNRFVGSRRT